jgi:hypothetical protein
MSAESDAWPRYFLIGMRPVKAVRTPNGGMEVLAYQWDTGEFVRDMSFGTQVIMGGTDVERVTEDAFEAHVRALRETA